MSMKWPPGRLLQKTVLVLIRFMVTSMDLTLKGSELSSLIILARMLPRNNCISTLNIQQIQLHRIISVHILIGKEELFLQQNDIGIGDVLLGQSLVGCEPMICVE